MIYKGVPVTKPSAITDDEALVYLNDQYPSLVAELGDMASIEIFIEKDDVVAVKGYKRSNIRRVRRITGYLSDQNNFNTAKRSELDDRKTHYE